ncbi:MAG: hypothetical protein KAR42_16240 [candidate division Zixibacteria bacterium]|nr:hypothetical protein [candidate division Zixibacteria bacterium]
MSKVRVSFTIEQLGLLRSIMDEFVYNAEQFDSVSGVYAGEYKFAKKLEARLIKIITKQSTKDEL